MFLESFEITVPVSHIRDFTSDQRIDKYIGNPVTVLIDKNFVYNIRRVDTGKPLREHLSLSYYQFVKFFFDTY